MMRTSRGHENPAAVEVTEVEPGWARGIRVQGKGGDARHRQRHTGERTRCVRTNTTSMAFVTRRPGSQQFPAPPSHLPATLAGSARAEHMLLWRKQLQYTSASSLLPSRALPFRPSASAYLHQHPTVDAALAFCSRPPPTSATHNNTQARGPVHVAGRRPHSLMRPFSPSTGRSAKRQQARRASPSALSRPSAELLPLPLALPATSGA